MYVGTNHSAAKTHLVMMRLRRLNVMAAVVQVRPCPSSVNLAHSTVCPLIFCKEKDGLFYSNNSISNI